MFSITQPRGIPLEDVALGLLLIVFQHCLEFDKILPRAGDHASAKDREIHVDRVQYMNFLALKSPF